MTAPYLVTFVLVHHSMQAYRLQRHSVAKLLVQKIKAAFSSRGETLVALRVLSGHTGRAPLHGRRHNIAKESPAGLGI